MTHPWAGFCNSENQTMTLLGKPRALFLCGIGRRLLKTEIRLHLPAKSSLLCQRSSRTLVDDPTKVALSLISCRKLLKRNIVTFKAKKKHTRQYEEDPAG